MLQVIELQKFVADKLIIVTEPKFYSQCKDMAPIEGQNQAASTFLKEQILLPSRNRQEEERA
jgi:hypothetical protein